MVSTRHSPVVRTDCGAYTCINAEGKRCSKVRHQEALLPKAVWQQCMPHSSLSAACTLTRCGDCALRLARTLNQ
jgi:hypothetical protein